MKTKLQRLALEAVNQLRAIADKQNTLNISDEGFCSISNLASQLEKELEKEVEND